MHAPHSNPRWSRLALGLVGMAVASTLACEDRPRTDDAGRTVKTDQPSSAPKKAPVTKKVGETPPKPDVEEQKVTTVGGFSTPESAFYDPEAGMIYVSNVNGTALDKDDNGFISIVSPEGKINDLKWIDGAKEEIALDAPKGMALVDNVLYVADIDRVRKFDRKSGEPKGEIVIEGATFLNDVVAGPDGTVYVSDTGDEKAKGKKAGAIHEIAGDKASVMAEGEALQGPNGLAMRDKELWVVSYRANKLMRIGDDGKPTDATEIPSSRLDGLVITDDGEFLVSSWQGKAVYRGKPAEAFEAIVENVESPADIGFDTKNKHLLIPRFEANKLEIRPYTPRKKHAAR